MELLIDIFMQFFFWLWNFLDGSSSDYPALTGFTVWEMALYVGFYEVARSLGFASRRNVNKNIELGWSNCQTVLDEWNVMLFDYVADNYPPGSYAIWSRDRVVIQRSTKGYPTTLDEGDTIYDSSVDPEVETIEDVNPVSDAVNYYTIFYRMKLEYELLPDPPVVQYYWLNYNVPFIVVESWPSIPNYDAGFWAWTGSQDDKFHMKYRFAKTFDFDEKFYDPDFLPEIYRVRDKQSVPQGQLEKFLDLLGTEFEVVRDKLEEHFTCIDPLRVDDDVMHALAWNIGWITNKELPIPKLRLEIANAVRAYKRKGTKVGLVTLIEGVTGWEVGILICMKNILYTDTLDSTTIDTTDVEMIGNMNTENDVVDYIIGDLYTIPAIIIYIYATTDWALVNRLWSKIERIIQLWLPVCSIAHVVVKVCNPEEGLMIEDELTGELIPV